MPDAEIVYRGEWRLPGASDDEVQHGVLRIREHHSATLELVDGFEARMFGEPDAEGKRPIYWDGHKPIIHGKTGKDILTLLGVNVATTAGLFSGLANQVLFVDQVLIGTWLDEPDEAAFTGVELSVDHLLFWASRTGFTTSLYTQNEQIWSTAEAHEVGASHAEWNGFRFTLQLRITPFYNSETSPNERVFAGKETASLLIEHDEKQTAKTYFGLASTFQDLMTLAMDYPCAIRAVTFGLSKRGSSDYSEHPSAKCYYRSFYPADSKPYRSRDGKELFRLSDSVTFEDIIPRWYELARTKVKSAIRSVLSLNYVGDEVVAPALMTQASALESLHLGLYDHPKMPTAEFETLKARALEGVDPKWTEMIKNAVRNDLSYAMRVRELLDKPDSVAVDSLLTDRSKWVAKIQKGRNALAHAGQSGSLTPEMQYALLRVTRTFSALVIAQDLGISPEAQLRFVQDGDVEHWADTFGQLIGVVPREPQLLGTFQHVATSAHPEDPGDVEDGVPDIPDVTESAEA